MRIWIDADAAPYEVKQVVFKAAKRVEVETLLVANQPIETPKALPNVRSVVVGAGADVADRYIVAHAEPGDVAVTADIPLADLLVRKDVYVVDPRGDEYSPNTIASRLSMRNFADTLRGAIDLPGGGAPYKATDKKAFAATFDRLLTKALRRAERAKEREQAKERERAKAEEQAKDADQAKRDEQPPPE